MPTKRKKLKTIRQRQHQGPILNPMAEAMPVHNDPLTGFKLEKEVE